MGKQHSKYSLEQDEEVIDTSTNKKDNKDVEMEVENQSRVEDNSEMLKSVTNDHDKSEISEPYEFDPFFGKVTNGDAINELQQRAGRSESIKNPILTSFWKMNNSGYYNMNGKSNDTYKKLEERGFTRHLLLEGKYEEALQYLGETLPDILEKEPSIKVSIYWLKLITIIQDGKFEEAIGFGRKHLTDWQEISIPVHHPTKGYIDVTSVDFFSLIAFEDIINSEFGFLLDKWQREVIADMVNDKIRLCLGGKEFSDLESKLITLNRNQQKSRKARNDLGCILQFRCPK